MRVLRLLELFLKPFRVDFKRRAASRSGLSSLADLFGFRQPFGLRARAFWTTSSRDPTGAELRDEVDFWNKRELTYIYIVIYSNVTYTLMCFILFNYLVCITCILCLLLLYSCASWTCLLWPLKLQ